MIKKVFMMILAAALMALPAVAQTFGTKHVEQPNAAFQSTSTMTGSGSTYSANPTLNSDGSATYNAPAYSPTGSGPRRLPGTQQEDEETEELPDGAQTRPDDPNPVGDAVLPLLLMSLAFCGYLYLRRKRSEA